jgi:hypothetical protein
MSPCHSAGTQLPTHRRPVYRAALGRLTAADQAAQGSGLVLSTSRKRTAVGHLNLPEALRLTLPRPTRRERNNAACCFAAEASRATGRTDPCAIPQTSRRLKLQASSMSRGRIPPRAKASGLPSRRTREALCGLTLSARQARFCSRVCNLAHSPKTYLTGPAHPQWKGDAARTETKHQRARKRYSLADCESCGGAAADRHHRDGDPGNNAPHTIQALCRRCHMRLDGRLARFVAAGKATRRCAMPAQPCDNCQRLVRVRRRGLCGACNEYWRTHGCPRPKRLYQRPACQKQFTRIG